MRSLIFMVSLTFSLGLSVNTFALESVTSVKVFSLDESYVDCDFDFVAVASEYAINVTYEFTGENSKGVPIERTVITIAKSKSPLLIAVNDVGKFELIEYNNLNYLGSIHTISALVLVGETPYRRSRDGLSWC